MKISFHIIFLSLVIFLLLNVQCNKNNTSLQNDVYGKVIDAVTGTGVSNATVYLFGYGGSIGNPTPTVLPQPIQMQMAIFHFQKIHKAIT